MIDTDFVYSHHCSGERKGKTSVRRRILVIDNDCDSLKLIIDKLNLYDVDIKHWTECGRVLSGALDVGGYSLVILSPGRPISVVKNQGELALVSCATIPVIGICYGFQVIAHAYGGHLEKLDRKKFGAVRVQWVDTDHCIDGATDFDAFGEHLYALRRISGSLKGLAWSVDGCEIIKVNNRLIYGVQFHPELGGGAFAAASRVFVSMVERLIEYDHCS
ncbi:MAG: hypothetical protein CVU69_01390 [Deltaproteobacteria bacterium HGW-Deltaproteobacteria-4]|nr:MAG: hypothetical protein CVU69_01390 [Deltaproteobacteria bacterium HGW-Deltaproteobacteria-4]